VNTTPKQTALAHHAITSVQAFPRIDTVRMFNGAVPDDTSSPIDQFITNTDAINKIYLQQYQTLSTTTNSVDQNGREFIVDTEVGTGPEVDDPARDLGGPAKGAPLDSDASEPEPDEADCAPKDVEGEVGEHHAEAVEETEVEPVIADAPISIPPELGALAVLGYMSAVESYFRALLRNLIEIDQHVRILAEPMEITFAAARYHRRELVAEALTEGMSFAGEQNVTDMLRKRIGIKDQLPVEVEGILKEFRKVCEIRHCCVHRFGRLGSKNAVSLGIVQHQDILEKPFTPTLDDLQTIADLLRTFVKTLNNYIFRSLIERIGLEGGSTNGGFCDWQWTGDFQEDSHRFERYYNLFASKNDTPPSPDITAVYTGLMSYFALKATQRKGGTRHPSRMGKPLDESSTDLVTRESGTTNQPSPEGAHE